MPASSGRSVLRVVLLVTAAVLVVALVVVAAAALVLVRRPLPAYGGETRIDGLNAEVEILRDARGVPQIYADTAFDLFRAQGYVHAQDRFFEMDYRRHVTAGRLAELVGDDDEAVASDAVVRTLGWRRVAEQELEMLAPTPRAYLEAYAEGVNDYIDGREASRLGLEYSILGLSLPLNEIEPWTPVDSLTWLKAVAWEMRHNYDAELERAAVFDVVGDVAQVEELFPAYPEQVNPTILPLGSGGAAAQTALAPDAPEGTTTALAALRGSGGIDALTAAHAALAAIPDLLGSGEATGSNSWVVSGELTESGRPILANDPHLEISAPGAWYQAGLHCREVGTSCPFDVAGFGFAGLPGVFIGHNANLAWGMTTLPADVTDFFLERAFEDGTYLRDQQRALLDRRTETISVNGGDDVELVIRSTVHGPIVSDVLPVTSEARSAPVPEGSPAGGLRGYAVALSWTALTPGRSFEAILAMNQAADAADLASAAVLLDAPSYGIVFATTTGDIGFQAAGRIPQRTSIASALVPTDGSWPRPGWDSRYDWVGFVAPQDLPSATNPQAGYVVAANNAVVPQGVGPFLTNDWDAGYRAQRITTRLDQAIASGAPITAETMASIQADTHNPSAAILVPHLLAVDVDDAFIEEGVDLLRSWDLEQMGDSAAAAYFASVWTNLLRLTFWDDVPEGFEPNGGSRWLEVVRILLDDPQSPWWDDRSTINVVETRDEVLLQALTNARLQLTSSLGKDPTRWEWSRLHIASPHHPVFGDEDVVAPVRDLMNPRPLPADGGTTVVLANAWAAEAWDGDYPSFGVVAMPSFRMVVDLGSLDGSTWVNFTGNSGHPGSRHYTDQFAAWAEAETFPWPFTEEAVLKATSQTRRLLPED